MSGGRKKTVGLSLLAILTAAQAGCGTILGGSSQEVRISSDPDARVDVTVVDRTVATPATLELKRRHSYVLTFRKEGYETETVSIESSLRAEILVLDILFTGLIGVAIDAGTGAWHSLSPKNVSVAMEKTDRAVAGPDAIEIRLTTEGGDVRMESGAPVRVEIRRVE